MIIPRSNFYVGIDPGAKGGIALMNAAGTSLIVHKMPHADGDILLPELNDILKPLKSLPGVLVGIEWPTAWPGAFNNVIRDAENFGRQKGVLEAFCYCNKLSHVRIPPQSWVGKLGLEGKTSEGAIDARIALFAASYPDFAGLVRGPRGGVLDGILDACLICHYMRLVSGACAASAVKGGIEHFAAVMSMGKGKRKLCRMPKRI